MNAVARPISFTAAALFAVAFAALLTGALFPAFPRQLQIHAGDVASRTIRAPRAAEFQSSVLTGQRREDAAAAVPQTREFDPSIRERQLGSFDSLTAQLTAARALQDETRKREQIAATEI